MPYTTVEIKKYRCALFSSGENPAKVSFYDSQGANFATAYIRPDSEVLPAAYKDSDGKYRLYYKYSRLPDLLDILRMKSRCISTSGAEARTTLILQQGQNPLAKRRLREPKQTKAKFEGCVRTKF
jgi:hypothetical protein